MPFTDYACPGCHARLHTDDLLAGECPDRCGETFPVGIGERPDLPRWQDTTRR